MENPIKEKENKEKNKKKGEIGNSEVDRRSVTYIGAGSDSFEYKGIEYYIK